MFLGCPEPSAELRRRSALYDRLPAAERLLMLRTAARNDLRGLSDPSPAQRSAVSRLREGAAVPAAVASALRELGVDAAAAAAWSARLRRSGDGTFWADLEAAAADLHRPGADRWTRTFTLSAVLARAGNLPVAGYAFGGWQLPADQPPDADQLAALLELATCYLYRLVPVSAPRFDRAGPVVGAGAYCEVRRQGGAAVKGARNLAAAAFLLEQEALVLRLLSGTAAGEFLPRYLGWDPRRRLLRREYVPGPTGHELLRSGAFAREPELADGLRPVHAAFARELTRLGLTLDLHPQNFVRHEREHRWVLVDVGPVPRIGFDYYDLHAFPRYLRATWERRLERMRTEPIRSLDWAPRTEDTRIPAR
jgi:hypothetical protein